MRGGRFIRSPGDQSTPGYFLHALVIHGHDLVHVSHYNLHDNIICLIFLLCMYGNSKSVLAELRDLQFHIHG